MVLLSLKVVKFDTKMYSNFSNFGGRTSAWGGGQALVQKRGHVSDRGIDKIFAGFSQSSQEKNPGSLLILPPPCLTDSPFNPSERALVYIVW